jgi:hypothetical protein
MGIQRCAVPVWSLAEGGGRYSLFASGESRHGTLLLPLQLDEWVASVSAVVQAHSSRTCSARFFFFVSAVVTAL